ncbi:MAG TPA: RNA methyltransferase [Verrucomicrobiae bacterium]|jgi:tRNA G18 (ribose-2'-O)-methylase SpoU|nr:RNA methyltransferase [Verrucomicrobiae bacterium]
MFHVRKIESFDLPELEPYRTMRRPAEHHTRGIFVAEGEKVVRRLLASDFEVFSVLLPQKWLSEYEPLIRARPEKDISVFTAELPLLETLVGFPLFQGVLAIGRIPHRRALAEILEHSAKPNLFVAVDGIANAENIGTIVRNCAAFGVQALIVSESSSSPFLRRAVRNSMGTIFQLPIIEITTLATALNELKAKNIHLIAAHPHVNGRTLGDADFAKDCCIVFGSEGTGLSPEILELCDDTVAIPMAPEIDSLNVNAAAAVFLYEVNRQRTFGERR